MNSTHTATLDIPQLRKVAKAAHVFPAMENNSLLSVVQLCDEGYYVLFSNDGVNILNENQKIIMNGPRDHATGLWRINLLQKIPHALFPSLHLSLIQPIICMLYVIQVH
jgi:hypothetical protein